jgi:hypothetical protein
MKQVPEVLFFPDKGRGPNGSRRGARDWPHHEGAWPRPWPCPPVVWSPWSTSDDAPSPIRSPQRKTLNQSAKFPEEFCSFVAATDEFRGTEVSIPAPYRDGEVPPEPSPSVSIAVSAVSTDLTVISINLAVPYDEEGVFLPRG